MCCHIAGSIPLQENKGVEVTYTVKIHVKYHAFLTSYSQVDLLMYQFTNVINI